MKLFSVAALLVLACPAIADTYTIWYDNTYDNQEESLDGIACSNGEHGLLTRGYTTFGSLGTYPFIGGAPQIEGWNSVNCGSCWSFEYTNGNGDTVSLSFTAINTGVHNPEGFTISLAGMNYLTGGHGRDLDGVSITVSQMLPGLCGL